MLKNDLSYDALLAEVIERRARDAAVAELVAASIDNVSDGCQCDGCERVRAALARPPRSAAVSALSDFHLDPPDWNDNPPSQANIDDAITEVFEDEDYLGEVLAESPAIAGYAAHLLKTSSDFRTAVLAHAKERIERRAQELADKEAQDAKDDYDDYRASLAHDEE